MQRPDVPAGGQASSAATRLAVADAAVHRFLVARSLQVLRVAVGLVFVYFGFLKLVPGWSPAEELVAATLDRLSFGALPGRAAVVATGVVECVLGVFLLGGWRRRATIYVLGLELAGILAPLVVLPGRLFDGPLAPTIEGQYVVKDVILVAAGMVLATTIGGGRIVKGPRSARPTGGSAGVDGFSADQKLVAVLSTMRGGVRDARVAAEHGITVDELHRWQEELLEGARAALTPP